MTDDNSSDVRTYPCPSPDNCPFTSGGAAELLEHVNTEHAGEFQRDDWPDTQAGRASRSSEKGDQGDGGDE
ncbi:hypothetical protein [Natrinema thermotolerans]|uniref:hypothetical protein n=1 Tax=Natrinema thermotolerans TaxID=121872 RepID=UPI000679E190|nr:hypothetical protein [Natrinema thermotolerans]QCC57383.1 hypothetical protein DVR14_01495 [Natrinema thermotolerans]